MADDSQTSALQYARVLGSVCVTVVALIAVDMPGGYAGAADTFSTTSQLFAAVTAAVALAAMAALYRQKKWAGAIGLSVYALNAAVLLPAFAGDPIISGVGVTWNVGTLIRELFELSGRPHKGLGPFYRPRNVAEQGWHRSSIIHIGIIAVLMTIGIVGYDLTDNRFVAAICLGLHFLFAGLIVRADLSVDDGGKWKWIRRGALALPVAVAPFVPVGQVLIGFGLVGSGLLVAYIVSGRLYEELLDSFYKTPSLLIVSAFIVAIGLGTILLTFPAASAGAPISPLDAIFTATSATCVTGLIVVDTATDFSLFGQIVILALFQIGGLGIMTLSTFAVLLIGTRLKLRGERALGEVLDIRDPSTSYRLVRFIVVSTLIFETIGAVILTWRFRVTAGLEWGEAVWKGIFHSVSSFCNAGFALQSDSFVLMQSDYTALTTSMVLITLGGLGFPCLVTLYDWLRNEQPNRSLRLHARVVLITSAILVLVAFFVYLVLEWEATLGGLSDTDKIVNALFQSVTLRTSGFNTVAFDELRPATLLMMILMMFIGASPGSTGGGIKTTTFAFLALSVVTVIRGDRRVTLWKRELEQRGIYRATGILFLATAFVLLGLFTLLIIEDQPFTNLAFEAVSAFGTVGLSLGATSSLTELGKLVIALLMFVGRVGPITLALLLGTRREGDIRYPRTSIMVG